MKILLLAGRYGLSGVPLAQYRLARALSLRGHDIQLIYGAVNPGNVLPKSQLFEIQTFGKPRVFQMFFELIRCFKKDQPDLVFTAGDHLNCVVLAAAIFSRTHAKISCSSRVTPYDTYSNNIFSKPGLLKFAMRIVSFRADVLTCVSKDMVSQYKAIFNNSKHICIYNIVVDEISKQRMRLTNDEVWLKEKNCPVLIAAGMLEPWKGFKDLIHAVKLLEAEYKIKLLILGDGSCKAELKELVSELNLKNSIKLTGYVENPLSYFNEADIFVLSSHVEGLPNVLVEAMMAGCTPVSTNCPTGPSEVLQNGKYGYLSPVNNPYELAENIKRAIKKPISKDLLNIAIAPFAEDIVIQKHFKSLGL